MIEKSSAHLRTLREAVGLSTQAAADLVGVSLRTWQYWESPSSDQAIKSDVETALAALLEQKSELVAEMLRTGGPVVRYRSQSDLDIAMPGVPIALHNAAVAAALETLGEDATVVWAETSPGED